MTIESCHFVCGGSRGGGGGRRVGGSVCVCVYFPCFDFVDVKLFILCIFLLVPSVGLRGSW